jgi:hypothetical protein
VNDGEHAAEWRTTPLRASHRGGSAEITKAPGGWWWVVSTPYVDLPLASANSTVGPR